MNRGPLIIDLPTGPLDVNCYVIGCEVSGRALVIDPGGDGKMIERRLKDAGLEPVMLINTHGHFDHIGGNAYLMSRFHELELCIHRDGLAFLRDASVHADYWGMPFEDSPEPTRLLDDGDLLEAGGVKMEVLHTPGHSPGGICLHCPGHLFTGDAIFQGSIGRTDLPGGDHQLLMSSINGRILTFPRTTVIHPGHGPATTVGQEILTNPFLR
jgi:hydroxyacylglutathione hydrolase